MGYLFDSDFFTTPFDVFTGTPPVETLLTNVNRTASIIGRCARYNSTTAYGQVDLRYFSRNDKLFAWDNNENPATATYAKNYKQRIRGLRNSNWISTRYFWPLVARTAPSDYGSVEASEIEAWWEDHKERELDATDGTGLYLHYATPEADSNRTLWQDQAGYNWIKFADTDVLEYIFGLADGSGLRTCATGTENCFAIANYVTSYTGGKFIDPCDYYAHDVWAPNGWLTYTYDPEYAYYPAPPAGNAAEYAYGNSYNVGYRWYEYLTAFKNRILTPFGRKVIFNLSQMRHNYIFAGLETVDFIDSDWMEFADGIHVESALTLTEPWTEAYDYTWGLESKLNIYAQLLADGKAIAAAHGDDQIFAFRLHNKGETSKNFSVAGNQLYLQDTEDVYIDFAGYTVGELVAHINTLALDFWEADTYDGSDNTITTMITEAPCNLRNRTAATVTADTWTDTSTILSPKLQASPRQYLIALFAYHLLLGIRSTDKIYLGLSQNSMTGTTPCHTDIHDLLPLLGDPDSRQTTWEKVNEGWGDVYYRLYENGVVFLNWEDLGEDARVISATDISQTSWYSVEDNIYTPGQTWTAAESITLAPKRGGICIYSIG